MIGFLKHQNIVDGFLINPYLSIPFYIILLGGSDNSEISLEFHGIFCFPDSFYYCFVSKYVNCEFVVKYYHYYEI